MTPTTAILTLIVRNPGMMSAAELSERVYPYPENLRMHSRVPRSAYAALHTARQDYRRKSDIRTTSILGELVRRRLVEPMRPPTVAPWFIERVTSYGLTSAVEGVLRFDDADSPEVRRAGVTMLLCAMTTADWRPGSSGAEQETYRALCSRGIIEAPTKRWPTVAGVERIRAQEATA